MRFLFERNYFYFRSAKKIVRFQFLRFLERVPSGLKKKSGAWNLFRDEVTKCPWISLLFLRGVCWNRQERDLSVWTPPPRENFRLENSPVRRIRWLAPMRILEFSCRSRICLYLFCLHAERQALRLLFWMTSSYLLRTIFRQPDKKGKGFLLSALLKEIFL